MWGALASLKDQAMSAAVQVQIAIESFEEPSTVPTADGDEEEEEEEEETGDEELVDGNNQRLKSAKKEKNALQMIKNEDDQMDGDGERSLLSLSGAAVDFASGTEKQMVTAAHSILTGKFLLIYI